MKRCLAALLAAIVVSGAGASAAEPPRVPFEVVPLPPPAARPHRAAYLCLVAGAGLIAESYALSHRADKAYDRYLVARVPSDIERWFDETERYDRWSNASLLGGEALVATGLYLRFLRRQPPAAAFLIGPGACAVSYRF